VYPDWLRCAYIYLTSFQKADCCEKNTAVRTAADVSIYNLSCLLVAIFHFYISPDSANQFDGEAGQRIGLSVYRTGIFYVHSCDDDQKSCILP
jgi:hypothetical protein